MAKKIGILTSGGDCPGLNAVIRAVVKCATRKGWEIYGIPYGTDGFIDLARGNAVCQRGKFLVLGSRLKLRQNFRYRR